MPNDLSGNVLQPVPTAAMIRDIQRASKIFKSCRRVVIDFETFYGTKYSLRSNKINYTEYVRHPLFAIMCVSIKIDNQPTRKLTKAEFEFWLTTLTPEWWLETDIIAHNMMFDGLILAEKYDIRPARWLCTLSLIRALFQGSIGADLDSVAAFLGLPLKPKILESVKDRHWEDLSVDEQERLMAYCAHDVDTAAAIADIFFPTLPTSELDLMHLTLQQFLEPKLFVDEANLQVEINRVFAERAALIAATGLPDIIENGKTITAEKQLTSKTRFADILRANGIEPPMKWSNKQETEIEAFSKTDLDWVRLVNTWRQEGRTQLVALADARMNCASSIHMTRPQRLLELGKNQQPIGAAYNYYGAHTGRWSGGNKLNFQNFKRKGAIRRTIIAPKGYVIVVVDASQIELRFNAWLHGEHSTLDTLRAGKCVYRRMAGKIYGLTELMADALASDAAERFVGKVAELGLGYQMSGNKFNDTLALGSMGPAVFLDKAVTDHIVYNIYRPEHPNIVNGWKFLQDMLPQMMHKDCRIDWKCLEFRNNGVRLPNGMMQMYDGLRFESESAMCYHADGMWKYIYGGLFDENLIQGLARIPVGDAMQRIRQHVPVVLQTHDEIGALAREEEADAVLAMMIDEVSRPPHWAPDIPLKAEGGYDYCYSK